MRFLTLLLSLGAVLLPNAVSAQSATLDGAAFSVESVATGLDRPVFLTAPAGDARSFIVEKTGRILILENGAITPEPFLDLSASVSGGNEQGLLGLAFHPDYAENGRFFVNYTDAGGNTQIVGYTATDGIVDPATATPILTVEQPFGNHNGGWLGFGPDGFLYIGMGDGGSGGDPLGNGQNPDVLLAKILRIDIDSAAPYAVPPGNPFANGGGAPEIFALGVRNPWRISFDGNYLWIADVGQNAVEEISVISAAEPGLNLGWSTLEGAACFPEGTVCVQGGFVLPIHTYSHDVGCSITGGYVYRGAALPALAGRYFFADYCSGSLFALRYENGAASDVVDLSEQLGPINAITSFGLDAAGELYVLTDDGVVLKLVPAT